MSDWYEVPYVTGPMVKVKGFPRPLYPPDAAQQGKKHSMDGPDIEAYKRCVSRAGRWQWQEFDDTFSNSFAHGKGPNVIDTGLAGVQRQSCAINDTGWLGKTTFDYLRSIVVPEGKPHAGEPCMDATAAKLIDDAFERFGGHEPAPNEPTVRQAALARAITQLGVVESPSGSNNQKYGSWYGMNGQPWCAMFVTWCYELGAEDIAPIVDSPTFVKGSRYAYVPYVVGDARANRYGLKVTGEPIPGDLVCYDWEADGVNDHIGIFEKWVSGTQDFQCIEGNTSGADNSNGGQVMRRTRSRGAQGTIFVRVAEP